jgi:Lamin Tail Domain
VGRSAVMAAVALGSLFAVSQSSSVVHADDADITINEISTVGDGTDWVELHNAGATDVDVSGWAFSDTSAATFIIPSGVVPAGGFLLLEQGDVLLAASAASAALAAEPAATVPEGFGFDLDPFTFWMLIADGVVDIDTAFWTDPPATSYGLCPDGQGELQLTVAVSKGLANICLPPDIPEFPMTAAPAIIAALVLGLATTRAHRRSTREAAVKA